jgi:hypothetical protein
MAKRQEEEEDYLRGRQRIEEERDRNLDELRQRV